MTDMKPEIEYLLDTLGRNAKHLVEVNAKLDAELDDAPGTHKHTADEAADFVDLAAVVLDATQSLRQKVADGLAAAVYILRDIQNEQGAGKLDKEEQALIRFYRTLDNDQKKFVDGIVAAMKYATI